MSLKGTTSPIEMALGPQFLARWAPPQGFLRVLPAWRQTTAEQETEREQAGTRSASYDLASRAISSACFLFVRSESLREAELGSSIGGHATHSVDIFKLSHCALWTQVDMQTYSPLQKGLSPSQHWLQVLVSSSR